MKKILALVLCIILLLSFTGCSLFSKESNTKTIIVKKAEDITTASTEAEVTTTTAPTLPTTTKEADQPLDKSITPLLYKVTDDKNNTIWLFGSIHVGKDYFYPLPDYVTDAYKGSDALAVEFDTIAFESDTTAQIDSIPSLIYTDGTTIKDHLSEETYNQAVEILEELGIYDSLLDYYLPYAWADCIELEITERSGLSAEYGIDSHFLNDAYENDKEIIEVESAKFQYNMMANFSEKLQVLLLESSIYSYENQEEYKEGLYTLLNYWESGDEKAFAEYLYAEGEFESKEEEALYKEYNDEMIVKRNISMTDFAEESLKSGKEVFIVVGAAHVVGEEGMSGQLKDRGYNVEIIK